MSLLLDALKRAEQEKLARQGPSGPESTAEPPLSRSTAAFELEAIESARPSMLMPASGPAFSSPPPAAAPSASAARAAPAAPAGPAAGDRANAQAIFAAKVPRQAAGAPSKAPLFVGAAVIVLLVVAGAAYVWMQLNAINAPRQAPPARPSAPPPVTSSSVIRNVTPITSTPSIAEPRAPLMPPAAPVPPPASGVAPGSAPYPRARADSAPSPAQPASVHDADSAVASLLQQNAQRSTAAPDPLRLARSTEQPRVSADVRTGYDWLVRGELQAARRSYLAALATDPNSIDALLGLATIDARTGERPAAARGYRRVLAADPRNTAALAGLAAVSDYTRPEALEGSLQADIQRYPGSAALRVALGNLYASQSRWTEAQAVFFEAHRLEPDNADVLFNVAVSLDHLKQPRLAAEYYGRALAQANGRAVQFDLRAAERRAADLKR